MINRKRNIAFTTLEIITKLEEKFTCPVINTALKSSHLSSPLKSSDELSAPNAL